MWDALYAAALSHSWVSPERSNEIWCILFLNHFLNVFFSWVPSHTWIPIRLFINAHTYRHAMCASPYLSVWTKLLALIALISLPAFTVYCIWNVCRSHNFNSGSDGYLGFPCLPLPFYFSDWWTSLLSRSCSPLPQGPAVLTKCSSAQFLQNGIHAIIQGLWNVVSLQISCSLSRCTPHFWGSCMENCSNMKQVQIRSCKSMVPWN